jgi:DNA-binding XRE family transcriptional regulator
VLYPIGRGPKGCDRASIADVPRKALQRAKHPALRRLGANIRQLRSERGLSQEATADLANIGRSYMSGIERGVRNCSTLHLIRIARALRVSVADLFPEGF